MENDKHERMMNAGLIFYVLAFLAVMVALVAAKMRPDYEAYTFIQRIESADGTLSIAELRRDDRTYTVVLKGAHELPDLTNGQIILAELRADSWKDEFYLKSPVKLVKSQNTTELP
jgi:hypothetical protein